ARNSITHKGWGPTSCAVATLDISHVQPGDVAGLGMIGKSLVTLAVDRAADGETRLILGTGIEHDAPITPKSSADIGKTNMIHLALQMDFRTNKGKCAYSLDGNQFTPIGDEFPLMFDWRTGTFQGEQYALFCYNPSPSPGFLDVDGVH